MESRWNEITSIWKNFSEYQIGYGILLVLIGIWIGSLLFASDAGYGTNLYTEALGVLVTIAVLDRLDRLREISQIKQRLIREAASRDNSTAINAVDWMRHEEWLTGKKGLLKAKDLSRSNLSNAYFGEYANLSQTNFFGAELSGTTLYRANLSAASMIMTNLSAATIRQVNFTQANLTKANLSATHLMRSDLSGANLRGADLSKADLSNCLLQGTNLSECDLRSAFLIHARFQQSNLHLVDLSNAYLRKADLLDSDLTEARLENTLLLKANLKGVRFDNAIFNEKTVLPDAKLVKWEKGKSIYDKYWTPDTDMTRYTDPNHPDFWQPEWAKDEPGKN